MLLEILVKANVDKNNHDDAIVVKEIPYSFIYRQRESKLGNGVIQDYVKAVNRLYKYKKQNQRYLHQKQQLSDDVTQRIVKRRPLFSFASQASKGSAGMLLFILRLYTRTFHLL